MEDQLSTAKLSADTVIDEVTGIPEVTPVSTGGTDQPAMSVEESKKQTAILMDMRETVQSMGLSYISDGNVSDYKQYFYEPWAKNLLIDAWHPIIQQHNLKVNPYIHILYAEGVASGPLIALAVKNRKYRLQAEEAAAIIRKQQKENEALKAKLDNQGSVVVNGNGLRNDTKNQWKIDTKGFFVNRSNGDYIPASERKEKPELTPESYALLIKHNDPELVNKIFKI